MTKDGRPSRINDIRYFHPNKKVYLEGHHDVVAFGRRLAWYLNGEGFSLGAYHSLYIFFTPTLASGAIQITDEGGDWWQRYTHVGVPQDFPNANTRELVVSGTLAALKAIRPDLTAAVQHAEQLAVAHGDDLRFLVKTHQTKRYVVEISFNISVWPEPSLLFVSLTDRQSDTFLEAPPFAMQFYAEAFDLAGAIKVTDTSVTIRPHPSFSAMLTSARHGGPLVKMISQFLPKSRPAMSKLVRRRG
jgi:hypothetical protein